MGRKIFILISTILLTIVLSISCLYFTNGGMHLVVNLINKNYKNNITIKPGNGSFSDLIKLDNVVIKSNGNEIILKDVSMNMSIWSLLLKDINIKNLGAASVYLKSNYLTDSPIIKGINLEKITQKILTLHGVKSDIYINNKVINLKASTQDKKIKLSGPINNYDIDIVVNINDTKNHFKGIGSKYGVKLRNTNDSNFKANIEIDWKNKITWTSSIKGISQGDNKLLNTDIDLITKGTNDKITLDVRKLDIPIHNKEVKTVAFFETDFKKIIGSGDITYDDNKADFKILLDNNVEMTSRIDIKNLNDIFINFNGNTNAKLTVSGPIKSPKIQSSFIVKNFNTKDISLSKAVGYFSLEENTTNSKINISDLSTSYFYLNSFKANMAGPMHEHTLKINASNDNTIINSSLKGKLKDNDWVGTGSFLEYKHKDYNTTITKPFTINFNKDKIDLNNLCLYQNDHNVCAKLQYNFSHQKWDIDIDSDKFSILHIGNINIFNIINVKSGIMSGKAKLKGQNNIITNKEGQINFKDVDIVIPKNNIRQKLDKIDLNFDNKNFNFEGSYDNTFSDLNITGNYNNQKKGKLKIKAKNIDIINNQSAKASIDADVNINVNKDIVDINGNAKIIKGQINSNYYPSSISLPIDIKISGIKNEKTSPDKIKISPNSKLNLDFGDNTNINIMNTKGNLTGNLIFEYDPEKYDIVTTGELQIKEAFYKKYGKKLSIKKGSLSYKKDNIDNPHVDIIASRNIQDFAEVNSLDSTDTIEVGINVVGSISYPKVHLFANPDKYTEEEIISLLVFGKIYSLESDNLKNINISSAAVGSQVVNSSGILSNIGKALDLDQVSIYDEGELSSGSDDANSTMKNGLNLAISKQLSKKLLLTMVYGLYDDSYKFSAQYKLYNDVVIKAYTSGSTDGISLIYNF
jgi:autotransporter translocation and assembly factor TamB